MAYRTIIKYVFMALRFWQWLDRPDPDEEKEEDDGGIPKLKEGD